MELKHKTKLVVAAAALAMTAGLPSYAAERTGGAEYISGGVGFGAREAMRAQAGQYNLHLEFVAGASGEYLSDVEVNVADARGNNVLSTRTEGPWLFARLPAGSYAVTVRYGGSTRTQHVNVGSGRTHVVMRFSSLDEHMAGMSSR
jgi:hypothetical protein